MSSTTGTRPNHYDTLGINPAATAEEIEQAYVREVLRPRAFGGLAQVGIAYATLKDAAKRRAYDEAIGIAPKTAAVTAPMMSSWRVTAAAHFHPPSQAFRKAGPLPASQPAPEPTPPAAQRPESFIAASLRELANPDPLVRTAPEPRAEPQVQVPPQPGPKAEVQVAPEMLVDEVEETAIDWRRPAMIGGGLLLGAVLFGAWAGTAVRDPDAPLGPAPEATMPVPSAKPPAARAASATEVQTEAVPARTATLRLEQATERRLQAETSPARTPMPRPIQLSPAEEQELAGGAFADSAASQVSDAAEAIAEVKAPSVSPSATAARLPLSERTVARTIGRIGYACGSVASITSVDGSAGVFKVTCTSGHSYQARPVRGRYHFRRWGRS